MLLLTATIAVFIDAATSIIISTVILTEVRCVLCAVSPPRRPMPETTRLAGWAGTSTAKLETVPSVNARAAGARWTETAQREGLTQPGVGGVRHVEVRTGVLRARASAV
jgi:hypothetical protein